MIKNQRGSILLNAIVMTLVIGGMSAVMLQQANTTEKTIRVPRIRAAMVSLEGALRFRLMQPSSYQGCGNTGTQTCTLDPLAIQDLKEIIPGCAASGDTTGQVQCGVSLDRSGATPFFDGASRTFTGQIIYEGQEVSVKPTPVSVVVPVETLQATAYTCPQSTPFFQGYDPGTGAPVCRAIPSCPAGQFVKGFDPVSFQPICQPITSNPIVCNGALRMVRSVNFANNGQFTVVCDTVAQPSTVFGP